MIVKKNSLTTEQLAQETLETVRKMSPEEKAELRAAMNRSRRRDGSFRAWFASAAEAVAFAEDPRNHPTYQGDVVVRCQKPEFGGFHLSRPD